ncbi:MAG: hypothetical protein JWO90_1682 [Solirubrobacterales bacterium]|nr:hypothetical protein [Solirubrobacterales bacterium]
MPAPRRRLAALLVTPLLAGCGNDPTPPPDVVTPGPPLGANPQAFPAAGVAFTAPAGWDLRTGEAPLVASVATGRAAITVFRYPRTEPLPGTPDELDAAAEALVGAAKQRDPGFVELKRDRVRVDGRPAVVLRGTETIDGQPRTVRSTHVYAFDGEVVIDALAPAADFKRVDAEVFRPLVRSLDLSRPRA